MDDEGLNEMLSEIQESIERLIEATQLQARASIERRQCEVQLVQAIRKAMQEVAGKKGGE